MRVERFVIIHADQFPRGKAGGSLHGRDQSDLNRR
jgi:hypothetical protein